MRIIIKKWWDIKLYNNFDASVVLPVSCRYGVYVSFRLSICLTDYFIFTVHCFVITHSPITSFTILLIRLGIIIIIIRRMYTM